MKIQLEQIEVLPGRPVENTEKILARIEAARQARADLVVFPEMAVPGYLIGDEWERRAFLRECEECGRRIGAASSGMVVAFGNVGLDWTKRNEDGRVRKYGALFVAENGRFVGPENGPYDFVIKTLMPNYREFDDSRYFFDTRKLALELGRRVEDLIGPVRTGRGRFGCVLCEDAWDGDYTVSPLGILAEKGVDLLLCASCSPFTLNKNHKRNRVFAALAERMGRPLVYVNNVGIQNNGKTVFTFDGQSGLYDSRWHHVSVLAPFEEGGFAVETPAGGAAFGEPVNLKEDDIAGVCRAVLYGTRKFMDACGVKRVTVGVSGGVDSALTAAIYSLILKPEDLLLVSMPGPYTSATTRALARKLAEKLRCFYAEVPIGESANSTVGQVNGMRIRSLGGGLDRKLELSGAMQENVQARDRSTRVLAAVAAAFGGVFTCNANKSEATVGYTTMYGDLAGYFAMLADLWKGEVYALARHMNEQVFRSEVIPRGCFTIKPSAELSAAQDVDKGLGDPLDYPYHDCLFRSWVESWNRTTPEEIVEWYLAGALDEKLGYKGRLSDLFPDGASFVADLERWWNLYQGLAVAKRIQAPPVLAIRRRAFGFDHRESQLGPRYTRRYFDLKKQVLSRR